MSDANRSKEIDIISHARGNLLFLVGIIIGISSIKKNGNSIDKAIKIAYEIDDSDISDLIVQALDYLNEREAMI